MGQKVSFVSEEGGEACGGERMSLSLVNELS